MNGTPRDLPDIELSLDDLVIDDAPASPPSPVRPAGVPLEIPVDVSGMTSPFPPRRPMPGAYSMRPLSPLPLIPVRPPVPAPSPAPSVDIQIDVGPALQAVAPESSRPDASAAGPAQVDVPIDVVPEAPADRMPDVPPLTAERLPPNFRKHVDPSSPAPVRGMAAKGLVPLNPGDMVHCLAMLSSDPDARIASSAKETIGKLPAQILSVALRDDSLSPRVLDVLCENMDPDRAEMEALILNPSIHDLSLASLARRTKNARFLEIMAGNQLRILREPELLRALLTNPVMARATSDSVCDFAVRSGVILHDLPQFAASYMRVFNKPLPRQGSAEDLASKGESAEELMRDMASMSAEELREEAGIEDGGEAGSAPAAPKPLKKKDETVGKDGKKRKKNITQRILEMNVSEKIKLASQGSMEARTILLRDPNRMIQSAVINSPKISDNEVMSLAQSKNTGDEVLRTIMHKREWTRQYRIRMALIQNPKTPAQTAIRMLDTLREADVKKLAKDKNVSSAIQQAAKKKSAPKQPPNGAKK